MYHDITTLIDPLHVFLRDACHTCVREVTGSLVGDKWAVSVTIESWGCSTFCCEAHSCQSMLSQLICMVFLATTLLSIALHCLASPATGKQHSVPPNSVSFSWNCELSIRGPFSDRAPLELVMLTFPAPNFSARRRTNSLQCASPLHEWVFPTDTNFITVSPRLLGCDDTSQPSFLPIPWCLQHSYFSSK